MALDTWDARDFPILEAIARVEGQGDPHADMDEIVALTGLEHQAVALGLRALHDAGYVTGSAPRIAFTGWFQLDQVRLLAPGRRITGQWPEAEPALVLLVEIDARLATATGEERTKLGRLREAIVDVGTSVASALITDVARKVVGS